MLHPDSPTLLGVRTLMDEHPDEWNSVKKKVLSRSDFELGGDSLKRAPKGFDPDHALIIKKSSPLINFICDANDLLF